MPTAANAGYYASIVAEKALLRRLVEAGTRIVQMGYAGEGEVTDLVNNAQAEIYGVTGSASRAEDYVPLTEAVTAAIDEIEAAKHTRRQDDRRAHRVRRARRRSPTASTPGS